MVRNMDRRKKRRVTREWLENKKMTKSRKKIENMSRTNTTLLNFNFILVLCYDMYCHFKYILK